MFQLRNHQNTVIDILSKNRKGQVIVPTGGGKTMCMIEDAKKVSGTVVVVVEVVVGGAVLETVVSIVISSTELSAPIEHAVNKSMNIKDLFIILNE